MPDRIFICRCEDVTLDDVEKTIELGLCTIEEIKRYTGLGTGPCQGKECLVGLTRYLLQRQLLNSSSVQPFTARPPTEAVTFAQLATFVKSDP